MWRKICWLERFQVATHSKKPEKPLNAPSDLALFYVIVDGNAFVFKMVYVTALRGHIVYFFSEYLPYAYCNHC
jgi:hypothetical protein